MSVDCYNLRSFNENKYCRFVTIQLNFMLTVGATCSYFTVFDFYIKTTFLKYNVLNNLGDQHTILIIYVLRFLYLFTVITVFRVNNK